MSKFDFVFTENTPQTQEETPTTEQPSQLGDFKFSDNKVDSLPEQVKIEEDLEGYWDWASLEAARTFFEAASFNLGDNAANAIVATYYAMNDENPMKDTWKAYYDIATSNYREGQDQYAKDFKGASTALEVAGAIFSPASYLKAPSTLKGMIGRGAAEGALTGAGKAENKEEILDKATEGALWGGGGTAAVGFMFKGLGRKNIQKDLDSVDEKGNKVFTSVTLAADKSKAGESSIQGLYRDIVAPTYLAKTVIKNQEELIMNPLERRARNAKENLFLIGKDVKAKTSFLKGKFKESKEQMRDGFNRVNSRIGSDITDASDAIKANNEVLKEVSRSGFSEFSIDMNQAILKDAAGFREQVLNLSFPVDVSGKARQGLVENVKSASTPQKQYDALDALWRDAGFEIVKKNAAGKDRFFPMRVDSLSNAVYKRILDSDRLSAKIGNKAGLITMIENNLGFLSDKVVKGRIKADTLMTNRNELAMKANSMADTTLGDADRAVLRAAIDVIDTSIIAKLPSEKARKSFIADKEAWASYTKYKDAVQMKTKAGEFGMFTPADYIDVLRKHSKGQAGKGKSLLQGEAEVINSRIVANTASIKENAHTVMRDVTKQQTISLRKLSNQKTSQLEEAKKAYKKQFKGANSKYEESLNRAERGLEIQKLNTELTELGEHIALLDGQRTQKNPSWFQSIAAVGLLGGFFAGGAAGVAGAAAIGTGIGAGLATKTGQRMVAGQTGVQKAIRNNTGNTLQTSKLLGRLMAETQVD